LTSDALKDSGDSIDKGNQPPASNRFAILTIIWVVLLPLCCIAWCIWVWRGRCRFTKRAVSITEKDYTLDVNGLLSDVDDAVLGHELARVCKRLITRCHAGHYLLPESALSQTSFICSNKVKTVHKGLLYDSMDSAVIKIPDVCRADECEELLQCLPTLAKIRHPTLPLLYGAIIDPLGVSVTLVYEWVQGRDLQCFLHCVDSQDTVNMMFASDILIGLHYLHSQRPPVVHDDMSLQNILVDESGSIPRIKILKAGMRLSLDQPVDR